MDRFQPGPGGDRCHGWVMLGAARDGCPWKSGHRSCNHDGEAAGCGRGGWSEGAEVADDVGVDERVDGGRWLDVVVSRTLLFV